MKIYKSFSKDNRLQYVVFTLLLIALSINVSCYAFNKDKDVQELITMIESGETDLVIEASIKLREKPENGNKAIPYLISAYENGDENVRLSTIRTIGYFDNKSNTVQKLFSKAFDDDSIDVRYAVLGIFMREISMFPNKDTGNPNPKYFLPVIKKGLNSEDEIKRYQSVMLAGELKSGIEDIKERLIEIARDDASEDVRKTAIKALKKLGLGDLI